MGNTVRALVVDDEIETALLMKMILEREGHFAIATASPHEALELATQDDFDVILTDFAMDELDGLAICERVASSRPDTAVVVFTGQGNMDVAIGALRAGAHDFLMKPIEAEALLSAVANIAGKRLMRRPTPSVKSLLESTISGASPAMQRVRDLVARIAASDASVVVHGETGTGKERVARALHDASGRTGAFVPLNCAAVPANLIESELFGHTKGAYTDARSARSGLFVEARSGTIFLDEIGDLPIEMQPKLLRALQERRVRPVGANAEVAFDARVVCATHRNLADEVREKRFREDLLYRIDVVDVHLPPLRDRGDDIIELAHCFLNDIAARSSSRPLALSEGARQRLLAYAWPGNVRELENCMERASVFARSTEIRATDLPEKMRAIAPRAPLNDDDPIVSLADHERDYVCDTIERLGGNKSQAARQLGMDRKTLYRKLARWARKADK